ncbi:E3 ubiquitin-protein ligase herc2, variant 2 [Entomophthora muscae]|uniref:E3 ubiquitin-protein ligase herc2, variant 2 n=2 Tax=Entomophthora muscae TaxID=34485 RepID=A0ACC2RX60_9FUNG|nr:E3 ubiquitin-protein ligase herc2, variant 2 [Entomophthora muscae]
MALYSLGANGMGQLGLGHCDDIDKAQKVQLPFEFSGSPKAMVCGGNHTLVMDSTCQVFVSGSNGKGRLFLSQNISQLETFAKIGKETNIVGIGAGFEHSCLITNQEVVSHGSNSFNQLGCSEKACSSRLCLAEAPLAVSCGPRTTCVIAESGQVWCWGKGHLPSKMEVPPSVKVRQGFYHTVVLTREGFIFTSGKNTFGQRGTSGQSTIEQVFGIHGAVVDIQVGWHHCLALTACGNVWGWGRNDKGQLNDNKGHISFPVLIPLPGLVKQIACGAEHSVVLTEDSKVYAWGWNEHGNCGQSSQSKPLCLPSKPLQIAAGYGFTLVWCCS